MDTPVAIKATAGDLACLIYLMVTEGQEYVEQGIDAYEKRRLNRRFAHLDRQAQELGFQLIPKTQGEEQQNPMPFKCSHHLRGTTLSWRSAPVDSPGSQTLLSAIVSGSPGARGATAGGGRPSSRER